MIAFIQPVFNQFTLELPPFNYRVPYSGVEYEDVCNELTISVSDLRKAKRTRSRLEAVVAGGWVIEFEPHHHLGLQNSKRPEQRRAQLGRA